jgi:hypothetical protein
MLAIASGETGTSMTPSTAVAPRLEDAETGQLLRLAAARRHLGESPNAIHDLVQEALAIADRTGATLIQPPDERGRQSVETAPAPDRRTTRGGIHPETPVNPPRGTYRMINNRLHCPW